jgi:2,3-bisphosphoglycerate-independent phosphoglycerate mutase
MRPIVLTILDGWGYSSVATGNAIANAKTPTLNDILQKYPSCLLQASGPAVGMTFGESGNSEVGHLTLGAGRVIFQYLTRINKAIATGQFETNTALQEAAHHTKTNNSTLHIAGLLTSGAVHAHFDHLVALVDFAKANQLPYQLHLFTDGRDSGLKEAAELFKKLEQRIGGLDTVASVIGRDLVMDRNNRWELIEGAFNLLTKAEGTETPDIYKALSDSYAKNVFDAAIPGTVVHKHPIQANDAVVFFNFREDSMREIVQVFTDEKFDKFQRTLPANLYIASMTQYLESPLLHAMFPPPVINHALAEVLTENNKKHFHIAETEKYAHVTFFFNGLRNTPYEGETDFFIESLEGPIEHPEMRAADIAAKVAAELDHGAYDFYVINIANGDILAHLGNLEAATKGVEAADAALAIIREKVLEKDGVMIITADHGNVESMIYKTGEQETKHDDNPVPFMLIAKEYERQRTSQELEQTLGAPLGILSDVAPTVLELMQIKIPAEMTGTSLLPHLS